MNQGSQDGPDLPLSADNLTAESAPADQLIADSRPIGEGLQSVEFYTDERGMWRTRKVRAEGDE